MDNNVQWIKMKVGMFDGESFKRIKRAKIGGVPFRDKLTAVWFELLDLAAKGNSNGMLVDNNELPYKSFEDIAYMIDREEEEVNLCIKFFEANKMIEIIDDVYMLSNFAKYQCIEGLEKIREKKRIAQQKWRESKKQQQITHIGKEENLLLLGERDLDTQQKIENVDTTVDTSNVLPSYIIHASSSYSSSLSTNNTKLSSITIYIDDIVDRIKLIYKDKGYKARFNRTATTKKIETILKTKDKAKRLYPIQIIDAYKLYIHMNYENNTEWDKVKGSDTFLTNAVYDFAEKAISRLETYMTDKYGADWNKIKFDYQYKAK